MALTHPAPGFITGDRFGSRPSTTANGYKTSAMHGGQDFFPAPGASRSVVAAADGVVVRSPYNASAGNALCIRHDLPGVEATGYAHLATRLVSVGTKVTAGQVIGVAGSTGASTGVHLHWDVFADLESFTRVDPLPLIGSKNSTPAAPPAPITEEDDMRLLFHPDIKAITWPNLITNTYRDDVYGAIHGYVTTYDNANGKPNAKWAWARETFVREAWAAQKLGKAA